MDAGTIGRRDASSGSVASLLAGKVASGEDIFLGANLAAATSFLALTDRSAAEDANTSAGKWITLLTSKRRREAHHHGAHVSAVSR